MVYLGFEPGTVESADESTELWRPREGDRLPYIL